MRKMLKCPECGKKMYEDVLASNPPQYQVRCDCGYLHTQDCQHQEEFSAPTIQQHLAELEQWLQDRGVIIVPCVMGARTKALSPIEDFLPTTHAATWALQVIQEN